jgi:hypothetical protein
MTIAEAIQRRGGRFAATSPCREKACARDRS